MYKSVIRNSTLIFFIFLIWNNCFANVYESSANITEVTKKFLLQNVPIEAGEKIEVQVNIPSEMRVAYCAQGITAAFPKETTAANVTSVELSCQGNANWHTFVPVVVQIYTPVIVSNRMILNKEVISENDITTSLRDKNRLFSGYYKTKEEVIGMEASQNIIGGAVFSKQNIQHAVLVHRNQTVDLTATRSSLTVTTKGIAKSDGRLNEVIKAFNPASKKVMDVLVVGENRVEVIG